MPTPAVYTPEQIKSWDTSVGVPEEQDGVPGTLWLPARPLSLPGANLRRRLFLAWQVFTGRFDALDWGKGDRNEYS